jgi:hypothetical protein
MHTHTHTHTHVYIHMCIDVCIYACVCVCQYIYLPCKGANMSTNKQHIHVCVCVCVNTGATNSPNLGQFENVHEVRRSVEMLHTHTHTQEWPTVSRTSMLRKREGRHARTVSLTFGKESLFIGNQFSSLYASDPGTIVVLDEGKMEKRPTIGAINTYYCFKWDLHVRTVMTRV